MRFQYSHPPLWKAVAPSVTDVIRLHRECRLSGLDSGLIAKLICRHQLESYMCSSGSPSLGGDIIRE